MAGTAKARSLLTRRKAALGRTQCLKNRMSDKSRGFTLMELVTLIIILGILSAIALPRLVDLTNETLDGSVQGVAGSLGSASAINYAAFVANPAKDGVQRLNAANVCTEAILGSLMVRGGGRTTSNGIGNGNGNGNNGNGSLACSLPLRSV
jgi:prepilin-type N-terminal cleavage/methylation domain-containing protein